MVVSGGQSKQYNSSDYSDNQDFTHRTPKVNYRSGSRAGTLARQGDGWAQRTRIEAARHTPHGR
jgi:hypothetical protein